jgi:hypothetical protein
MTAIMGVATLLPQLATDLLRSQADLGLRCQKVFGLLTGIWGLVSSLSIFARTCRRDLEAVRGSADFAYGPGFICFAVATFLKAFDVIAHAILAVPEDPKAHRTLAGDCRQPPAAARLRTWRVASWPLISRRVPGILIDVKCGAGVVAAGAAQEPLVWPGTSMICHGTAAIARQLRASEQHAQRTILYSKFYIYCSWLYMCMHQSHTYPYYF